MRYLATLAHEPAARQFGDYLLVLGIPHQLEAGEKGWDLWIHSDDDLERARRELSQFEQDPRASRYGQAAQAAGRLRAHAEKEATRRRRNFIDVRTRWAGLPAQGGFPLTLALIILAVVATGATHMGRSPGPLLDHLFIAPAGPAHNFTSAWPFLRHGQIGELLHLRWEGLASIRHGQVWRLLTPIFLHFGILHLLFDLWWLYDLGRAIETRKGTWTLLGIVLLGGMLGNLAQYLWSGPLGGGMSGVVYALFGYLWIKGVLSPREGLGLASNIVWLMLGWLALCMTGLLGPIGNAAHLTGLLTGVILAAIPQGWRRLK